MFRFLCSTYVVLKLPGNTGADCIRHGSSCVHFYKWLDTWGTVSRRTANKKLTKLY